MNAPETVPLFRVQALQHRAERLHGNVSIATPIAWQTIGFLLFATLVVALAFLSLGSYSRTTTVSGVVVLDKGVATIIPSRAGIVSSIGVLEGQQVRTGDKLIVVRAEESMIEGATAPERIRNALGQEDARLEDQSRLFLRAADADQARLNAQIDGDLAALPNIEAQITDQELLVRAADEDYRNALEVAKGGFVSKREIQDRQATVISRRQQLAQLKQALSSKRADIAQAGRAMAQVRISAQAQAANAQSGRAALSRQLVQADLAQGYALTSPVDGVATAITARLGQPASPEQQLMLVVPARSRPRIELYVPTSAAGFLAPGQEVRLSIDAFPYQTFGTIEARVTSISSAVVSRQSASGSVPVYLVSASIAEPWILAFGHKHQLLHGMTLSARIVTEEKSLIEWLFEPLFAVRKR